MTSINEWVNDKIEEFYRLKGEMIDCRCGGRFDRPQLKKHIQSRKHQHYIFNRTAMESEVKCDCGVSFIQKLKSEHIKTKEHNDWVKKINRQKVKCECGVEVSKNSLYKHQQSLKHREIMMSKKN